MENLKTPTNNIMMKSKIKNMKRGTAPLRLEINSLDVLSDPLSLERQLFFSNKVEKLICNGNKFSRVINDDGIPGPFIEDKNAGIIFKSFKKLPVSSTTIIYYDKKINRIILHEVSKKIEE